MKIRGLPGTPSSFGLKGHFYTRYDPKRGWIAQAWPKKKAGPPSPAQLQARADFTAAARAVKMNPSLVQVAATEATTNSPYLPRDAMTSAAFGLWASSAWIDGVEWKGIRDVASNIQTILDSITNIPGSLLLRGETEWIGLNGGALGDVLTIDPATGLPAWAPQLNSETWTPTLTCTTPGDLAVTYTVQKGSFTKLGPVDILSWELEANATWTTASGTWEITGMPLSTGQGGVTAFTATGTNISYGTDTQTMVVAVSNPVVPVIIFRALTPPHYGATPVTVAQSTSPIVNWVTSGAFIYAN